MILTKTKTISPEKLRRTLFLYSAIIFLMFSLVLILTTTVPVYNRLKEAENIKVLHDAQMRAMAVNEWLRSVKDLAFQVTSRTRIRQELEKYNTGSIPLARLRSFTEPKLSDAMNLSEEIMGITRLDQNGLVVAQCGEIFPGEPFAKLQPFKISFSKPFKKGNTYKIIVSAPILNRSKVYLGADRLLIDLCYLKKIVTPRSEQNPGYKTILGVTSDGADAPVSILFDKTADSETRVNRGIIDSLLIRASRGESGTSSVSSNYVEAYQTLEIENWGLIVLQNKKALYESINTRLIYWGITAVIAYLLILGGLWLLMNPLANKVLLHTDELREKIRDKTHSLEKEINERKQAERKILNSEQRLNQIIEFLPDPTWVIDISGNVIAWNKAIEKMTKVSKGDIIGKGKYAHSIPFYGTRRPSLIDMVISPGKPQDDSLRVKTEDGELFSDLSYHPDLGEDGKYLSGTAGKLYDAQGQIVGAIETIRDVTDQQRLETEREDLIRRLQKALDEIKTLGGLIPICAKCKKIRDDKGYWNVLESYIQEHTNASFSHGMCPDCMDEVYGDQEWYMDMKKEGKDGDC